MWVETKEKTDRTMKGDVVANFDEVVSDFNREMWSVIDGERARERLERGKSADYERRD